jgi:DNA uptake protein ComE-like DNA-binding protein
MIGRASQSTIISAMGSGTRGAGRSGSALIIVMVLTLGLVSMALLFTQSMMFEYRAAANSESGFEAEQAVEGARRFIAYLLANTETPGQMPDAENHPAEDVALGNAHYWIIGRGDSQESGVPVFGLVDEASKLNINTATLEMLEALPGMTAEIAAAIVDWRDTDSVLTAGGAEAQDYLMMDPAYNCKDAPFETLGELRLVKGVDLAALYGKDKNMNGVLDPNEDDGGAFESGILENLTVWSREPNRNPDGEKRLNLSTATPQALRQVLETQLDASRANEIVQRVGNVANIRSPLEFLIRGGVGAEEAAKIESYLSTTDDEYMTGLVNINTAPRVVLAALPGIGENNADAVVAWREGKTAEELASVRWLADAIESEAAIRAGRFVTCRTYQVSADVTAVGSNGRGFRRSIFVFDLAESQSGSEDGESSSSTDSSVASTATGANAPIVVFRGDRSGLGWPLGASIRADLKNMDTQGVRQ